MLVACRLAGLSALERHYAGVNAPTQSGARSGRSRLRAWTVSGQQRDRLGRRSGQRWRDHPHCGGHGSHRTRPDGFWAAHRRLRTAVSGLGGPSQDTRPAGLLARGSRTRTAQIAVLQSECSICWLPIAIVQGCCLLSQTEWLGPSKSGSANIPTATAIRSGRCSASQKTVLPHSGQK